MNGSRLRLNRFPVTIASRTSLIAADVILIAVTWRYASPEWKRIRRANPTDGGIGVSLYGVLLRDGKSNDKWGVVRLPSSEMLAGTIYFV